MLNRFCLLLLSVFPLLVAGQEINGLVARYTFNHNNGLDDVGKKHARIYNVLPAEDRFGNKNFAYQFLGNAESYMNLGTDNALKPRSGTISLWIKITLPAANGLGISVNPIIHTRSSADVDFNEAYGMGYNLEIKKSGVVSSVSEQQQVYILEKGTTPLDEWFHAAMTFDGQYMCYYINGVLQGKLRKNFGMQYLEGDSVLLGMRYDEKNQRFLFGFADDIEVYNRALSADEVQLLYERPNPNLRMVILTWVLVSLAAVALVVAIFFLIRWRINLVLKRERQANQLLNKSYEQEMKVLKAQMNPHFIFNSLNSIQQFIIRNDNENAQTYLSKFSRLLRKLLESNTSDHILLTLEIELLERYLEIESLRFNYAFNYTIAVGEGIAADEIHIPHFLIQPFVENAIWHGLLPKDESSNKQLSIVFELRDCRTLVCTIEDNGVGRQDRRASGELDGQQSMATEFIRQRLELMSRINRTEYSLLIIDKAEKPGEEGTTVILTLPVIH